MPATGRRKEAVARVNLKPGTGRFYVNGRSLEDYFSRISHRFLILETLDVTDSKSKFDCVARVNGGGIAGQAGALRHGLARALVNNDETNRTPLRQVGALTRDARSRERQKCGQKGARKKFQWTKR